MRSLESKWLALLAATGELWAAVRGKRSFDSWEEWRASGELRWVEPCPQVAPRQGDSALVQRLLLAAFGASRPSCGRLSWAVGRAEGGERRCSDKGDRLPSPVLLGVKLPTLSCRVYRRAKFSPGGQGVFLCVSVCDPLLAGLPALGFLRGV